MSTSAQMGLSFKLILLKYNWFKKKNKSKKRENIVDLRCWANFCCIAKWFNYTYIHLLFHIPFHYGLSQDIEHSFLCYTLEPWWVFFNIFKNLCIIYLATLGLSCSMWDLVPWPGIKLRSPALGAQSMDHQGNASILFIHSIYNSLHLLIPPSVLPSLIPLPLGNHSLFSMFLFYR